MSSMAIFWLCLAIFMGVLEVATINLASIWFVGGAMVSFVLALFGVHEVVQVIVFLAVSITLLLVFRKTLWESTKKNVIPTNADRFLGKIAVVTSDIDNVAGTGSVKIGGMEWTARTTDGAPIQANTQVIVNTIQGVTMYVAPAVVSAVTT